MLHYNHIFIYIETMESIVVKCIIQYINSNVLNSGQKHHPAFLNFLKLTKINHLVSYRHEFCYNQLHIITCPVSQLYERIQLQNIVEIWPSTYSEKLDYVRNIAISS